MIHYHTGSNSQQLHGQVVPHGPLVYTKSGCTIIESNNAALLSLHVVALMGLSQNCDIYSVSCVQTSAGVL